MFFRNFLFLKLSRPTFWPDITFSNWAFSGPIWLTNKESEFNFSILNISFSEVILETNTSKNAMLGGSSLKKIRKTWKLEDVSFNVFYIFPKLFGSNLNYITIFCFTGLRQKVKFLPYKNMIVKLTALLNRIQCIYSLFKYDMVTCFDPEQGFGINMIPIKVLIIHLFSKCPLNLRKKVKLALNMFSKFLALKVLLKLIRSYLFF